MTSDSPLLDAQTQAGAVLPESPSAAPPVVHFGDPAGEHRAARNAAAIFDLSDRPQIELTGRDRAKFLHNFCTNDIKALQPGQGCEAFVTNVKGRILGHVFVFADDDSLWIETVPGAAESLLAHLNRYRISEDVEFHDRTAQFGEQLLSGPEAAAILSRLGAEVDGLTLDGHASVVYADIPVSIRHVDWLGGPGFLLSAPRGRLADLWRALGELGVQPAGSEAFHALRIEAGFPLYGIDITEDQLAQEASRTRRAISFKKGCYLGQEPIARVDALGHVNRELRGLRLESTSIPERGTAVVADEKEIGTVTSAAISPIDGRSVALAYVRTKYAAPQTEVGVRIGESPVAARVFWPEGLN